MEKIRNYCSTIQVPSWSDVKSGEAFRRLLRGAGDQDKTSWIKDSEVLLVQLQEILIWTNVTQSAIYLVLSQLFLYQFCISSTPLISSTAYLCLVSYLYVTWTQRIWPTIKIPDQHKEDAEKFTTVNPDVLSAPELENINNNIKLRISEITTGLCLMRAEVPTRFCITLSTFFICLAILGAKISTAVLIHSSALLLFILPPLVLHLIRNESTKASVELTGEVLFSLSNLLIYTSSSAPPQESHELDDFIPEQSKENLENLDISIKQKSDRDPDLSVALLDSDVKIPSHEEVDQPASLSHLDLEADLLPALKIDDHESEEEELEGPVGRLGGVDDSDSDTADPQFSLTSAAFSSYLPSVTSAIQSAVTTQILGSSSSTIDPLRRSSEPDLEDFELISDEEFEKATGGGNS